jgi:hypothetical protein
MCFVHNFDKDNNSGCAKILQGVNYFETKYFGKNSAKRFLAKKNL